MVNNFLHNMVLSCLIRVDISINPESLFHLWAVVNHTGPPWIPCRIYLKCVKQTCTNLKTCPRPYFHRKSQHSQNPHYFQHHLHHLWCNHFQLHPDILFDETNFMKACSRLPYSYCRPNTQEQERGLHIP